MVATSHAQQIAEVLDLEVHRVRSTVKLLEGGATVPFIARYRKEATGSLDETQIRSIRDHRERLAELAKRKQTILESLTERALLTDELARAIEGATQRSELEDLYLPYRPKRRTKALIAREKGLEPLANQLLEQRNETVPEKIAQSYIARGRGVANLEEALAGARDIIAERVSENPTCRATLREMLLARGTVTAKVARGKKEEGAKYRDYFDWSEPVTRIAGHRLLALLRGEREGMLSVHIRLEEDRAHQVLYRHFLRNRCQAAKQVQLAIEDGYKRLLAPSLESDARAQLKERADLEAIGVFADNLQELLLQAPLGQKSTLALDPGFRSGCKVVCLDPQGRLVAHDVIYPHSGDRKREDAARLLTTLLEQHAIEAIAVGNGTASRETEQFVKSVTTDVPVVSVNESGASIYSASDLAREEFPDHDVTVRGAVSIGRRLMDPLSELIKLDPKSIGVGQYQHDVDQKELRRSLDDVVVSCVNKVGVDLNTASPQLLTYVSGLGKQLALGIVRYRDEHGPFQSRTQLKKVPRLGARAFEQCAGFLRVQGSKNPLDASAVHPESYPVVDRMATDLSCTVSQLLTDSSLHRTIDLHRYVDDRVGLPTLEDILDELSKPGRDPREAFEVFSFAEGVDSMNDLRPGMRLPGIVTNVTAFGAFVDIGVHQDGLVHISQLANRFVKDPGEIVRVQQQVTVTVLEVDHARKRIALSMIAGSESPL